MPTSSPHGHVLRFSGELFSIITCDFQENVKARITDPFCGDLSFNGGFISQKAKHSENIYLLWRHHIIFCLTKSLINFLFIIVTLVIGYGTTGSRACCTDHDFVPIHTLCLHMRWRGIYSKSLTVLSNSRVCKLASLFNIFRLTTTKTSNLADSGPLWMDQRWPVVSPQKGPVMPKVFPCYDVGV